MHFIWLTFFNFWVGNLCYDLGEVARYLWGSLDTCQVTLNPTVRSEGLTQAILNERALPLAKGGEGLNCRKRGRRICPSRNVTSQLGVWAEVSRNVSPDQLNQQPYLRGVYGLVVWASLGKNEHGGKCKVNETPSPASFTPGFEMTFQSSNGVQNSGFVSVWGPISSFSLA